VRSICSGTFVHVSISGSPPQCMILIHFQYPTYADAKLDTNERPFTCYCGLAFTRRDLLRRHEKLSHAEGLATGSEHAPSEAQHPQTGQHHQFYRGGDGQKSVPSCNDTFQQLSFSPMQEHSEPRTGWSTLIITSARSLLSCDNVEA
jgi:hypothetical protein